MNLKTNALSVLLMSFAALAGVCLSGADEAISVQHFSLSLGGKTEIALPLGEQLQSALNSQERILRTETRGNGVQVEAVGFGEATLTLYCQENKIRVYRISVVPQGIQLPTNEGVSTMSGPGSRGKIGTRIGFRSLHGLFETLVQEEEFLQYQVKGLDASHELQTKTIKPINYPSPKAERLLDTFSYLYQKPQWTVMVGDTDVIHTRSRGGIRGLRIDYQNDKHHPYLFGGIVRSGVQNFLWGTESSSVFGGGETYQYNRQFSLKAYALGFKSNPSLSLNQEGWEVGMGLRYSQGVIRDLNFDLVSDGAFRLSEQGNVLFDFEKLLPLSLSFFGGHTSDQMAVYTLPSRFSTGYDSYGGAISMRPASGAWEWGASVSRNLQLVTQDEVLGKADLRNGSANLGLRSGAYHSALYGNTYTAEFIPIALGSLVSRNRDEGQRLEWMNEYAIEEKNHLTLNAIAGSLRSQLALANYENEEVGLGAKHLFYENEPDFVHLELGVSRFRYPNLATDNGNYFLTRLSAQVRRSQLRLDGMIQNELRLTGRGKQDNLRLQLALNYQPHPRHEFVGSIYNQFDWQRRIYSNFRGLYLQYAYHFGSLVPSAGSGFWSALREYRVQGQVIDEGEASSASGPGKQQVSLINNANGQVQIVDTDSLGLFAFTGVRTGTYQVWLKSDKASGNYRLTTPNPRTVSVIESDLSGVDFIFSKNGSVAGYLYHDLNGNGQMDMNESPVEGLTIRYRPENATEWKRVSAGEGQFQIDSLAPGNWELTLDSATLPPGFRADKLKVQRINLKANGLVNLKFAIEAERSISGVLFRDKNGNRIFDAGEEGIDGVEVEFKGKKARTGEGGHFIFKHLRAGAGKVSYGKFESEPVKLLEEPTQLLNVYVPVP